MKRIFLCLAIIPVLILACDPLDTKLSITNNTDERIYYIISPYDSLNKEERFLQPIGRQDPTSYNFLHLIEPNEITNPLMHGLSQGHGWHNYIDEVCKDRKLKVFILDQQLVDSVPWEKIVTENIYKDIRIFTRSELDNINWNIIIQ
jgi:hypothetical protein